MAKLTFVLDDGQEIVVPLTDHVTLGREEDNDVVIDDDRVSKHHAELVHNADGTIQLFDSNSTAGTFVNGERIRSRTIHHGDKLTFGPLTAVLDLADHAVNGTAAPAPPGDKTQALTLDLPVRAEKIATRKRNRGGRPDSSAFKQTELQEATARLEREKASLQSELDTVQNELRTWQEQSAAEHAGHLARMESLRAEEERLTPIKTAVNEAETAHAAWLQSIQTLTAQHVQKTADLQRLGQDEAAARHELEGLATHRDQALAHLQQIRAESVHDETVLDALRHQIAELQTRSQQSKEIAEVREDQLKAAEKKIEQLSHHRTQIEEHILELTGTEEKLVEARAHCIEAEAQHVALKAEIAALGQDQHRSKAAVKDLESRIATLQQSHQQAEKATGEALASRQRTEEALNQLQSGLAASKKDLAARKTELAAETQQLAQTQAQRAELEQQCQTLADTGQKLTVTQSQLATAEQQLARVKTAFTAVEAQIAELKSVLKTLSGDESAAKGRIDILHAREKDLRAALTQLGAAERSQRTRFEEVRQLATEAEKEHAARQQQLTTSLESTRSELADLLSRRKPLRDWKEAMDQLYARLATLPQDSAEARDLWHEIEKEKAGLYELINTARTQAQVDEPEIPIPPTAPPVVKAAPSRRTRAGGAPALGTAQETTLRSRLRHLRESVQREESRLEHLRREHMRHDTPLRPNPAAEAMMREQTRHLETRLRQDQERHHALQRSIELSQAEEDKRRERLGELEHKLVELRTDITEAERQRSELRQQAGLAHTELKNFEAAIDRLAKKSKD
ncbi:MAG: FHA domain-containing protein [Prosthecobacter sp.]|uniref:FHA domain-containing protein n=1 Tax=Prosthecobacter sp. TaxID=1965333 RepID=UPI00263564CE|nr:FHA domain-containing protein [Prosthecobacter sp.]MCF7790078.1 FHA domain-containing protein [Prosthecobacter sp.]